MDGWQATIICVTAILITGALFSVALLRNMGDGVKFFSGAMVAVSVVYSFAALGTRIFV